MPRHAMRPFRIVIHTVDGEETPPTVLMATTPREAVVEALGNLYGKAAERLGRVEVTDCTAR